MITKNVTMLLLAAAALATTACGPGVMGKKSSGNDGAEVYEMTESSSLALSEVSDAKTAETYALQNGYYDGQFCKTYLKGGEGVWFSASYDQGEAGQAYGALEKDGDKLFFNQHGMSTGQAMFAPGLGAWEGKSLWEFNRYFKTICSVAFGKGRAGNEYDSVKAEKVSIEGGTAGGSVAYQDALKLSLGKRTSGGRTDVVMIFAKGLGPRVVEFRETNMPAGTSKVYIGQAGSGAKSSGRD